MSTSLSATSSSYEPYAFAVGAAETSLRNCVARDALEELAAATTVCLILWTERVVGSIVRSLAKDWAIAPVARMPHRMVRESLGMMQGF